jgi:hypothetical protein
MGIISRHNLRARMEGRRIIVETPDKRKVKVGFAATQDSRTCYAYVKDMGFIGGFQVLPLATMRFEQRVNKKDPWMLLADRINDGFLYSDMADLPGRKNAKHRARITCGITVECPGNQIEEEEKNAEFETASK